MLVEMCGFTMMEILLRKKLSNLIFQDLMRTAEKVLRIFSIIWAAGQPAGHSCEASEPNLGHMKVLRQFPFYQAYLATLQVHGIITVCQCFDTCLSDGIDKSVSLDLMILLQPRPMLRHKVKTFIDIFL